MFNKTSRDPYEKFILQHLRHYGLFQGRGTSFLQLLSASREPGLRHDPVLSDIISSPAGTEDTNMEEEEEEEEPPSVSFHLGKVIRTRQLLFDFDGGRPVPRLREPLNLFSIPSSSCSPHGIRWPIECDVIKEDVQHIEWDPPEPEPFNQFTGQERTPMPVGDEKGNVVFCIDPATKMTYFSDSRVGGSRGPIKNARACANREDETLLVFESRFESGNLQKAVQVGLYDYELTLRCDLYTNKHTQWFYFQVRRMKSGVTYRFTIANLMKASSLYSAGMRPLLYSERAARLKGKGWHRAGTNIRYYRNYCEQEGKALYSLTWTLQFPYDDDTCYLAHCYPYTYSQLQRYLRGVVSDPAKASYCKIRVLCRSLAGNSVYVLTVTAPSNSWQESRSKRAVVVTARVHPGETNGSWMMQGFLDFLLGDSPDARLLRETFIFKVVPMLNPDGVVVGNYRCSLSGRDLNRNYRTLLREAFPCVWYTRNMVKRLLDEREVVLYCDFHGHSRKNNVFMYGCDTRDDVSLRLHERVFPLMMSKNATDQFSFRSCKFKVQKSKEGTGRIVMWKLGIRNSYTMESTFGGSTLGNRKGTHFSTRDLKRMGYYLCETLLDFCDPDQTKTEHCLAELRALLKQDVRQKLGREVDSDGYLGNLSDIESSTSGSNSTESDGLPLHFMNCSDQGRKKKVLRTRKERNRLRKGAAQNTRPKVFYTNFEHLQDPTDGDMLKMRHHEKTTSDVKENKKRQKVPFVVRLSSQTGRSGAPHPIACIDIIDHVTLWEDKIKKRQTQHHALSVPPVQYRYPSVATLRDWTQTTPVQLYPMPFNPDIKTQACIKDGQTPQVGSSVDDIKLFPLMEGDGLWISEDLTQEV
ncbi:cytosolic carboxypeptidase 2 [Chanos chanos]|uniref:Cytosolic carboxypeptidase 2 n=1 Tax=Chanos chanos TaxID=29144 RepID=A0A6J2UPJ8_CHACN|nr:cytosolic carboxypeptidase 2 [Chanos chanos]